MRFFFLQGSQLTNINQTSVEERTITIYFYVIFSKFIQNKRLSFVHLNINDLNITHKKKIVKPTIPIHNTKLSLLKLSIMKNHNSYQYS